MGGENGSRKLWDTLENVIKAHTSIRVKDRVHANA